MNDTLWEYCQKYGIVFTRSRAYRKNDQAWVEQKNGAIVRKLIGYGRLEGLSETAALRRLYESSRLYINFFQPSFKLKSKTREGARVHKKYELPETPCGRLLLRDDVSSEIKEALKRQMESLDPVLLLKGLSVVLVIVSVFLVLVLAVSSHLPSSVFRSREFSRLAGRGSCRAGFRCCSQLFYRQFGSIDQ